MANIFMGGRPFIRNGFRSFDKSYFIGIGLICQNIFIIRTYHDLRKKSAFKGYINWVLVKRFSPKYQFVFVLKPGRTRPNRNDCQNPNRSVLYQSLMEQTSEALLFFFLNLHLHIHSQMGMNLYQFAIQPTCFHHAIPPIFY